MPFSTQWIGIAPLLPLAEGLLLSFPFRILGFHADNGSEYINHKVARLLESRNVVARANLPNMRQDKNRGRLRRSRSRGRGCRCRPDG